AEDELALLLLLLLPFADLLRQPVLLFLLLGQLLLGLGLVVGDRFLGIVLRRAQVVEVIGLLLGIGLGGLLGQHRLGGFILEVGHLLGHAREPLLVVPVQRPLLGEAVDRALLGPHGRIHSANAAVGARALGHLQKHRQVRGDARVLIGLPTDPRGRGLVLVDLLGAGLDGLLEVLLRVLGRGQPRGHVLILLDRLGQRFVGSLRGRLGVG